MNRLQPSTPIQGLLTHFRSTVFGCGTGPAGLGSLVEVRSPAPCHQLLGSFAGDAAVLSLLTASPNGQAVVWHAPGQGRVTGQTPGVED